MTTLAVLLQDRQHVFVERDATGLFPGHRRRRLPGGPHQQKNSKQCKNESPHGHLVNLRVSITLHFPPFASAATSFSDARETVWGRRHSPPCKGGVDATSRKCCEATFDRSGRGGHSRNVPAI